MQITAWKRRAEAVKIEGEVFEKLDLRSMKALGSTWTNCAFVECQLDLTDFRASKFERSSFQKCSMRLVNFSTSFFEDCLFFNSDLEQASFMGAYFRAGGFKGCRMAYGDTMFQDATIKGLFRFEDCNLHGSSLDFREVEPGCLRFNDCNLWGAKVSMGCAIWNGHFDDRSVRQFLALVARVSDDPRISALAGDQYEVVCRAMDGRKGCSPDSTSLTTSTPIQNFQDRTGTTATVVTLGTATPTKMMETSK